MPIGRYLSDLHVIIFWICVALSVGVFSVLIYSLIKYWRLAGHKAATFHSSLKVEILWVIAPFLILVVLAFPASIEMLHKIITHF